MKKILFFLLMLGSTFTFAQTLSGDALLFGSSEFVWCGFDYSKVKCIGPSGFNEPDEIQNRYFNAWNNLMLGEAEKYDFKKAYDKTTQLNDLSVVNRRNKIPEVNELVIDNDYRFKENQLKEIVADYDLEEKDAGLGLVYVVESLNKTTESAVMYVVFFDIASREILWVRNYVEPAIGFGFRNYWTRPIYETMKDSSKDFKSLQKSYEKRERKKS